MNNIRTIAIVDDHSLFRKGLIGLINIIPNYTVIQDAPNGKSFIEKLNPQQIPDLVLMDITMPEMDGYKTTEWLINNYPEVKVLALSTMDAETAIIKMIKAGARGYVLKDAEPDELKTAFDEVFSRGYYYNELVTRKVLNAVSTIVNSNNTTNTFINLSDREVEFLRYTCTELPYKEIADKMFVSPRTVDGYRDALFEKLNLRTRVGLAMYAIKNNLVKL